MEFKALKSVVLFNDKSEIDITNMVLEVSVYESILNHVISAELNISDTLNLQETFPILGKEGIFLEWDSGNNTPSVKKVFDIYAISNIRNHNKKTKIYTLKLMSFPFFNDKINKISKSFKNVSTIDIIKTISTEYLNIPENILDFDTVNNSVNIVIPNLSPFNAIDKLSKLSFDIDGSYLFFENLQGFNFKNVEKILENKEKLTITTDIINDKTRLNLQNAKKWMVEKSFDLFTNIETGTFSNKIISHDIINKKITEIDFVNDDYSYSKDSINPESNILISSDNYNNNDIQNKRRSIHNLNNYKILIEMQGNTFFQCGEMVKFVTDSTSNSDTVHPDLVLTGNYIVTKRKHVITQKDYNMTVQLNSKTL